MSSGGGAGRVTIIELDVMGRGGTSMKSPISPIQGNSLLC